MPRHAPARHRFCISGARNARQAGSSFTCNLKLPLPHRPISSVRESPHRASRPACRSLRRNRRTVCRAGSGGSTPPSSHDPDRRASSTSPDSDHDSSRTARRESAARRCIISAVHPFQRKARFDSPLSPPRRWTSSPAAKLKAEVEHMKIGCHPCRRRIPYFSYEIHVRIHFLQSFTKFLPPG